jgi:ribosome-binding factor A
MTGRRGSGSRRYPRTARLNELFREILGEELERIDDDRLELVTIMSVDVTTDLERATVYWSSVLADEESDEAIQAAMAEARPALQRAIGRQARVRRVPELVFRPDASVRTAERIEGILREIHDEPPLADGVGDRSDAGPSDPPAAGVDDPDDP